MKPAIIFVSVLDPLQCDEYVDRIEGVIIVKGEAAQATPDNRWVAITTLDEGRVMEDLENEGFDAA